MLSVHQATVSFAVSIYITYYRLLEQVLTPIAYHANIVANLGDLRPRSWRTFVSWELTPVGVVPIVGRRTRAPSTPTGIEPSTKVPSLADQQLRQSPDHLGHSDQNTNI